MKDMHHSGFTLLEVLLVLAVVVILTGIAVPVYQSFQVSNDLENATVTVALALRRAQTLSQAVDGDMSWGVRVQSGSITLFRGASYAGRDAAFDELFDLPQSITPSGTGEVVFAKLSGEPQSAGAITLTTTTNATRTITVSTKGTVNY